MAFVELARRLQRLEFVIEQVELENLLDTVSTNDAWHADVDVFEPVLTGQVA